MEINSKKKVLLLGDSIRLFYQDALKQKLGDEYDVFGPDENCRFSLYVLNSLRFWLDYFPTPDIIHWNVGLWDTAVLYPEDGCFVNIDIYEDSMKKILRELKKTGAKVIFSTTTPVADDKAELIGPMPPAHKNSDIILYNERIKRAFLNEDIIINDLHSILYDKRAEILLEDKIHPNALGIELMSDSISKAIVSIGDFYNSASKGKGAQPMIEKLIQ